MICLRLKKYECPFHLSSPNSINCRMWCSLMSLSKVRESCYTNGLIIESYPSSPFFFTDYYRKWGFVFVNPKKSCTKTHFNFFYDFLGFQKTWEGQNFNFSFDSGQTALCPTQKALTEQKKHKNMWKTVSKCFFRRQCITASMGMQLPKERKRWNRKIAGRSSLERTRLICL